jgi:enamine deaminase RidA (YjgF/YER057c/UK114 family)
MDVQRVPSDSPYAPVIGFSRAVRSSGTVFLAGISAIDSSGTAVGGADPYLQARECFAKMTGALTAAGASVADVVHTRMFLVDAQHWREVGRAHGEVFADAPPAATMVVVKELLDPRMLVEIEAVAVLSGDD